MKIFKNLINGKWLSCASGRTLRDENPADRRDVLLESQRSDHRDIAVAVKAAERAFPVWSRWPAPKRASVLFRSAQLLESKKETFASLMVREMGKPLREALADVQEAIDTAYFFAGEGRRLYGVTTPSELKDKMCWTLRRPVGVCGLVTPWNFPLAIPSWKVYPALICGNTAVLKPSEDTPLMALMFGELLLEAGLPEGVLNVVTGLGVEAGAPLAKHPSISMISFTGSSSVGSWLASECAKRHKRCALEMGGKNALIVMAGADVGLAVTAGLWGAFATSGQRCTATSKIILHKKIYSNFKKALLKRVAKLRVASGDSLATDVGPIINSKQLRRIHTFVVQAKNQGARVLTGGGVDRQGSKKNGFFYHPTVLENVTSRMAIARQEVFGPVVCLMKARDFEEAIDLANATDYGLSSAIFTANTSEAMSAVEKLNTGITYINSSTIGAEAHLPFGGTKKSGQGYREGGTTALDIFSEWKTVYMDYSGRLQRAQIDG